MSLRRRHFNFAQADRGIILAPSARPHTAHARSAARGELRHAMTLTRPAARACVALVACERGWRGFDAAWERAYQRAQVARFVRIAYPAQPAHMADCPICADDDDRRAL